MKRILWFLMIATGLILSPLAAQCNGSMSVQDDKAILHVWGTHYERGYAQGFLLADRLMQLFNNYFYPNISQNSPSVYQSMLSYYDLYYQCDPAFLSEAEGFVAGMVASGEDIYHAGLGRTLGVPDILLVNAIVDIPYAASNVDVGLGCASLSSFAESTLDDPQLQGSLVIMRLLDWTRNPSLIENAILIVHHPAEEGEVKWMSFGYPGLLGALSSINEYGHGAFLNMGNNHSISQISDLRQVLFSVRKGIERMDFNQDGTYDGEDMWAAISGDQHLSGTIIHSVWDNGADISAQVIETNNSGSVRRDYEQNGNLSGHNLAATNHFRSLYEPEPCFRYDNIQNALLTDSDMTIARQWDLICSAAGLPFLNMMAIQYVPVSKVVKWAVSNPTGPAYTAPVYEFDADDLFAFEVSNDEQVIPGAAFQVSAYPNPCPTGKGLTISASNTLSQVRIYNIKGQLIMNNQVSSAKNTLPLPHLSAGIYLIKATDTKGKSITSKIVVY